MWSLACDGILGLEGASADSHYPALFRLTRGIDLVDGTAQPSTWQCLAVAVDLSVHLHSGVHDGLDDSKRSIADASPAMATRLSTTPAPQRLLHPDAVVRLTTKDGLAAPAAAASAFCSRTAGPTIAFLTDDAGTPSCRQLHILHPTVSGSTSGSHGSARRRICSITGKKNTAVGASAAAITEYLWSSHTVSAAATHVTVAPSGCAVALLPATLDLSGGCTPLDVFVATSPVNDSKDHHDSSAPDGPVYWTSFTQPVHFTVDKNGDRQQCRRHHRNGRSRHRSSSDSRSSARHAVVCGVYARELVDRTDSVELVVTTLCAGGNALLLILLVLPLQLPQALEPTGSITVISGTAINARVLTVCTGVPPAFMDSIVCGSTSGLDGKDGALEVAAAWSFERRWQRARRFREALAEAKVQRAAAGFLMSPSHRCQQKRVTVRGELSLLACSANGRIALLRTGSDGDRALLCATVAAAPCDCTGGAHGDTDSACDSHTHRSLSPYRGTRCATTVEVVLPTASHTLLDAVSIELGGLSGFLCLTHYQRKSCRSLVCPTVLSSDSNAVEVVFLPYSGLAIPLHAVACRSTRSTRSETKPWQCVFDSLLQEPQALRIAAVTVIQQRFAEGAIAASLALRVVIARAESVSAVREKSLAAACVVVALPDSREAARVAVSSTSRHHHPAAAPAIVRLSLLSGLSFHPRLFNTLAVDSAVNAGGQNADSLSLCLFECAEGVALPASTACVPSISPNCFSASASVTTTIFPPAAAVVVPAVLMEASYDGADGTKVAEVVAVFRSVAAALHEGGPSWGYSVNRPLLLATAAALRDGVSALVRAGSATALVAALSFLAPHAVTSSSATGYASTADRAAAASIAAVVSPLFDAAYACVAGPFPELAEDLLPLCSPDGRRLITTARALLLDGRAEALGAQIPDNSATGATSLVAPVLARVREETGGLKQLTQQNVEHAAHRLFLEAGPIAAIALLDSLLSVTANNESIAALHQSYVQLQARLQGLATC